MVRYKIDVIAALRDKGLTTYKLRRDRLIHESVIQKFRDGKLPSPHELNTLCRLLDAQPGDILEYVADDDGPGK